MAKPAQVRRGWKEWRGKVYTIGRGVMVLPEGEDVGTLFEPGIPGFEFWRLEAIRRGDDKQAPD